MDKGRASQNPYSPSHIARWSISHHPCTQPSNLPPTYWNGVPQRQAQALAAKWSRFIPAKPPSFEHFRRSIWLKPLKKEMPKASPKSPRRRTSQLRLTAAKTTMSRLPKSSGSANPPMPRIQTESTNRPPPNHLLTSWHPTAVGSLLQRHPNCCAPGWTGVDVGK